jgi:hypothetical protein
MNEHGERWTLVFAMFMALATLASFCVCLHTAPYNMAHPVTYQDVFQLHGIAPRARRRRTRHSHGRRP